MPKKKTAEAPVVPLVSKEPSMKRLVVIVTMTLLILGLIAACLYLYNQNQVRLKNPTQSTTAEINSLVGKVAKHYELPKDEQATLATVSDVSKLSNQPFFTKAINGDKVLIYPKAGVAILYRPSTDKIINVGPINTQEAPSTSTQSAQPSAAVSVPVKIALYNGTKTNGLTTKVDGVLKTLSSLHSEVVLKQNAAQDYTESVVVDLTGKNAQAATQLAAFSKGKVASLPSGEAKPEGADILIILGQSYVGTPTPTATPTR